LAGVLVVEGDAKRIVRQVVEELRLSQAQDVVLRLLEAEETFHGGRGLLWCGMHKSVDAEIVAFEELLVSKWVGHGVVSDRCQEVGRLCDILWSVAEAGLRYLVLLLETGTKRIKIKHLVSQVGETVAQLHDLVAEALLGQQTSEGGLALDIGRAVFGGVRVIAGRIGLRSTQLSAGVFLEAGLVLLKESPVG